MAENTVLRLGFGTTESKVTSVNVSDPNTELTQEEIIDAMDEMIESGAISERSGSLSSRNYAKLVTTNVTDISLA
ncbi:MAG: DUF2922 domain-containing protein [Clostridiales bacterium]|nr:DUF2922 domain-containing protein [Clostridiales bacterium]